MSVSLINGHIDPEDFVLAVEARKLIHRYTDSDGYMNIKYYDKLYADLDNFFIKECGVDCFSVNKIIVDESDDYRCGIVNIIWTDPDLTFDFEVIKWGEYIV
jgi:hypothetical protein